MKKYIAAAALLAAGMLATATAQAQTATPFTGSGPRRETPKKRKASNQDIARMQQRMSMNAGDVKRDQQMEVLEARSGVGNSSLTRGSSSARQYDRSSGAFTVRKFKDKRVGVRPQKRGQSRPAPGIDPKGKPLKHKHNKKGFLFFR
ncbi:hypothetical protein [Solirubrum puertoriconensis]|uniref:Uncharacterized protein n=1 Tax=Solirubrum puertoriconensis TaxID=1751427 RepID=A0A9X0HLK5_SOLP1|nr:hypothetical protein [Solirubrum puertoriconensis]KUG08225.1 hypothetical protein ASU33_08555 [Solirubrum puertoriconensis]